MGWTYQLLHGLIHANLRHHTTIALYHIESVQFVRYPLGTCISAHVHSYHAPSTTKPKRREVWPTVCCEALLSVLLSLYLCLYRVSWECLARPSVHMHRVGTGSKITTDNTVQQHDTTMDTRRHRTPRGISPLLSHLFLHYSWYRTVLLTGPTSRPSSLLTVIRSACT